MRRRFQKGSLTKVDGVWIAQWWEEGHRRKRTLGRTSKLTKAQAEAELAAILVPVNSRSATPSVTTMLGNFVSQVYLPFYQRKWKHSTAQSNEERLRYHIISERETRTLGSFTRDELQGFLDDKADSGLSYSVVAHLRWDLRQVFRMAVAEGHISRNPAELLFIPRHAKRPDHPVMSVEEVRLCFSVLESREALITKLAILVGMRPGEIFALTCGRLQAVHAEIEQRIYRGEIDTPKSVHSVRLAALPAALADDIRLWVENLPDNSAAAWVFPSERLTTPIRKDNVWRRDIAPKLEQVGLGWVDFHVFRRTHSTLMSELEVDPKVVSDQLGHTLDVNQNVYTKVSLRRRKAAVDALEKTLIDG